jgi:hypothetical protein
MTQLLGDSLVERSRGKNMIMCHRMVQVAVLKSMDHAELASTFKRAVFLLNGSFPPQDGGLLLHKKWRQCELFYSQTSSLLRIWKEYQLVVEAPVLLCEIVRRCSWYEDPQHQRK